LASGLQLWKIPLVSLHLYFFVPGSNQSCTGYLTPGLPSFAQLKGENHTTWFVCLEEASLARAAKRGLTNAKLVTLIPATTTSRRAVGSLSHFLYSLCIRAQRMHRVPSGT